MSQRAKRVAFNPIAFLAVAAFAVIAIVLMAREWLSVALDFTARLWPSGGKTVAELDVGGGAQV